MKPKELQPVPADSNPLAEGVAYVRGAYVPIAEAAIPITDWGFLRSDATYDVVTVWEARSSGSMRTSSASCAAANASVSTPA